MQKHPSKIRHSKAYMDAAKETMLHMVALSEFKKRDPRTGMSLRSALRKHSKKEK